MNVINSKLNRTHEEIMQLGIDRAYETMNANIGGPFGAVITKGDEVIAVASNTVLRDNDPTCHAEMNAIREACKKLGTYDLSDSVIYCTSEPCPMCLSAIIWANIRVAYFGCDAEDAAEIGFRDDYIYKFIETGRTDKKIVDMMPQSRAECLKLFEMYSSNNSTIY